MTTLGQLAYEQHNRRSPEAPAWAALLPCMQRRWEHTACTVAAAVQPGMETLRAELAAARLAAKILAELLTVLPDDYGCHYTCGEAEAAAALYRVLGDDGTATAILAAHAARDEEGDLHYRAAGTVAS